MYKLIVTITLLFVFVQNAMACSCIISSDVVTIKDFNNAFFIVSGVVNKATYNEGNISSATNQNFGGEIDFHIEQAYKGPKANEDVKIFTSSPAMCGLGVQAGEKWIIWGYKNGNKLMTSRCSNSSRLDYLKESVLDSLRSFQNSTNKQWRNSDGEKIAEGKMASGHGAVGKWKYFYSDGFLEEEGQYKNGLRTGKWVSYGNPNSLITNMKAAKILPQDTIVDVKDYMNRLIRIAQYKNGIMNGKLIQYDLTNKPRSIVNYIDGKENGKSVSYHSNGVIASESNYKNGWRDGFMRVYYPTGELKEEYWFIDNKIVGATKQYDENVKLVTEPVKQ